MARARRAVARARARVARPRGCARSKSSTRIAPASATRRAWCWSRPTAASARWARSPTSSKSSRATSAPSKRCLGDLLQHVLVRRHEHAAAGLALVRAGRRRPLRVRRRRCRRRSRCGEAASVRGAAGATPCERALPRRVRCCCRASCAWPASTRRRFATAIGEAVIVDVVRRGARAGAATRRCPWRRSTATCCAARIWSPAAARSSRAASSATKREIKELRERVRHERARSSGSRPRPRSSSRRSRMRPPRSPRCPPNCIARKRPSSRSKAQLQRAADDETRLAQRARARRHRNARASSEEIAALDARQAEARESIARLDERAARGRSAARRGAATLGSGPRTRPTRWRSVPPKRARRTPPSSSAARPWPPTCAASKTRRASSSAASRPARPT